MIKNRISIKEGDTVYVLKNAVDNPERRIACRVDNSWLGRTIVYTVSCNPTSGCRNEREQEHELGIDLFPTMKEAFANRLRFVNRKIPLR